MAPAPNQNRCLARAGWSIISPSQSPEPSKPALPPEFNAFGVQLVSQVASSWTNKYQFTIKQLGFDGQSAFHYECIFSCPTNELPVPSFVLSTRWALVVPSAGAEPRLLYSFEEGDLRHEWALLRDAQGKFTARTGQQFTSLGHGSFESYMDRLVHEKEQVRDRGVDLRTSFEETRLAKPPAYEESSEDEGSEACESSKANDAPEAQGSRVATPADRPDSNTNAGQSDEDQGMALIMREALQAAGLYCDKVEPPSSLAQLLASIFDAADEETVGELPHYEVARLLSATLPGFGLEMWDIHLLLTSAQENDDGFIECKPFIQAAPEIIQALRKRRMAYRARGLPGVEVPVEAVKHCFTDEATATANLLQKVFDQMVAEEPGCGRWRVPILKDEHQHHAPNRGRPRGNSTIPEVRGSVAAAAPAHGFHAQVSDGAAEAETLAGIKRRFCLDCISSLPERLSPQEIMRLMQMLPEDEEGFVMIDEMIEYLEHLRTDAMLNALVESDVVSLRTHLVLRFRRLGLAEDGKLSLWLIKDALLQADQVCLSRLQIHVLLCRATADSFGLVDIAEFLGMCCVVIPHMFDAKLFVETAERLILEHAENMRKAENEELAALGAARVGATGGDGEETQENKEVDQETVERTLQQVLTLNDDLHRNPPALAPEKIYEILGINEKEVQSTQLSTFEIAGFLAEMQPDEEGLVAYVDHIKKWVPIIFEQRKNRLLGRYMDSECYQNLELQPPDLEKLEAMFPLLPYNSALPVKRGSQRKSSRSRENRDSFGQKTAGSHSNPPSHSRNSKNASEEKSQGSKNSPHRRANHISKQAALRRVSTNTSLTDSKRRESMEKSQEPPPGRGYQRRKARMVAQAAAEEAKHGGSKEAVAH